MRHSIDFAKTTGLFWILFHKIQKLHSYKTVYTIFRFILSFQIWENANNELSRPQRERNLLYSIIRASYNSSLHNHSEVWLWKQHKDGDKTRLMERDADIPVSNVSSPAISPQKFLRVGGHYSGEKIKTFPILPHAKPQKIYCLTWIGWNYLNFSLRVGRPDRVKKLYKFLKICQST